MNKNGIVQPLAAFGVVILIFVSFLGIGAFIGKSESFKNYLSNYVSNKEKMKQETWESASEEEKEQAKEAVNEVFDRMEARKIAQLEKDGTKKVLSLPSFWNGSIEDEKQACTVYLPPGFHKEVEKYKQMVMEGMKGYQKLAQSRPNCYRTVGSNLYFEHKITECSDIKEEHNHYYGDLYLKGSIDGREYVETYCDRFAL